MRVQTSTGHIFNVDGAGADGNATPRFAAYGASKRGLMQLGKSLQVILRTTLFIVNCEVTGTLYWQVAFGGIQGSLPV